MEREQHVHILGTLDHAAYDAALIQTWRPNFHWVRTRMQGAMPFEPIDFVQDTRRRIGESLIAQPEMKGQKFGQERTALTYVAFETLFSAMQCTHLRQFPPERLRDVLRRDFQRCLSEKKFRTAHRFSPLWAQGNAITQSNGIPAYELPMQSSHDRKLLECIAATPQATERFIAGAPFLAALDRGQVDVYEEGFRQEMWKLLEGQRTFDDELRESMRTLTVNTWLARRGDTIAGELGVIAAEVANDLEQSKRFAEIGAMDDEQLRAALKGINVRPRRDRKENMLMLLQREQSVRTGTALDLQGEKTESVETFLYALDALTQRADAQTPHVQDLIRKRLPALEYFALTAAADGEVKRMLDMQKILHRIEQLLHIKWGEYPTIAFVNYAIASHCTHVGSIDREMKPADLLAEI